MRTKLVPVGNSRGIRLPKAVLEQCGLIGEIDLQVDGNRLIIRSLNSPRRGWDAAFARMKSRGDDRLLDLTADSQSRWDQTEWKW